MDTWGPEGIRWFGGWCCLEGGACWGCCGWDIAGEEALELVAGELVGIAGGPDEVGRT